MLTPIETRHFRVLLEGSLADISSAMGIAAANDDGTVMLDQSCVGRLSRMDALQQQAMVLGLNEALQRKKRRLEAALVRLDGGLFGICCQCGEAVPKARLDADPGAPFCTDCQEAIEESRVGIKR